VGEHPGVGYQPNYFLMMINFHENEKLIFSFTKQQQSSKNGNHGDLDDSRLLDDSIRLN